MEDCKKIHDQYSELLAAYEKWRAFVKKNIKGTKRKDFLQEGLSLKKELLEVLEHFTARLIKYRDIEARLAELQTELDTAIAFEVDNMKGIVYLAENLPPYFQEDPTRKHKLQSLFKLMTHPNTPIRKIDLSESNIYNDGAQLIAEVLMHPNNRLKELNLSNNQIYFVGAKAIANAISSSQNQLVSLNLLGNWISFEAKPGELAQMMTNFVSPNSKLEYLDLKYNKISLAGINEIEGVINASPKANGISLQPQTS